MYSPEVNQPSLADPASPAAAAVPTSPEGEVRPQAGVGAPAFPTESPSSPPSSSNPQSKIPNPKSDAFANESALISAIAAGTDDPEVLAERHGIDLPLFLDWLRAPATTERINILLSARHIARENRVRARLDRAMDTLEELHIKADENADPVERRRSAATVARFSSGSWRNSAPQLTAGTAPASSRTARDANGLSLSRFPSHFRARSRTVREVPILHEPPAILPPPYFPHKDASPSEATIELLHRLQCNDNPRAGDGLRTLFNFFSPKWRENVEAKTADDFACTRFSAYHSLIAHHSAVLHPTQFPAPAPPTPPTPPTASANTPPLRATQSFDLIDLDGDRFTGAFHFTRASPSAPWLIDSLDIEDTPDSKPEPAPEPSPPNSS